MNNSEISFYNGSASSNDFMHFGVKGMRWGFRKKRKTSSDQSTRHVTYETTENNGRKTNVHNNKPMSEMSDSELKDRISRLKSEIEYKKLVKENSPISKGKKFLNNLIKGAKIGAELTENASKIYKNVFSIVDDAKSKNKSNSKDDDDNVKKSKSEKKEKSSTSEKQKPKTEKTRSYEDDLNDAINDANNNSSSSNARSWNKKNGSSSEKVVWDSDDSVIWDDFVDVTDDPSYESVFNSATQEYSNTSIKSIESSDAERRGRRFLGLPSGD